MARPSAQPARRRAGTSLGSRTDIGCVREHNEDSLVVAPPLYAVADGMGGHAAGEIASEIAVRTLAAEAPSEPDTEALGNAVVSANYAVINAAGEKGRSGMGTTVTAAILSGERLAIAQVGDSRAYLLHQGRLQQLTRDHSLMADLIEAGELTPEEARVHPQRSVITRALGSDPHMKPDLYEINVSAGDRLLLCSDGLSGMIEDNLIEAILTRTRDPQRAAALLVNEAIAAGGHDNVTVVVVDVEGNAAAREKRTRNRGRAWAVAIALALVAVCVGIVGGVYRYTQGLAYLTAQDGRVAVYQGIPQDAFGVGLSHLDRVTDVAVTDLEPFVAERLEEGVITAESLQEANDLVSSYESYIAEQRAAEEHAREKAAQRAADEDEGLAGMSADDADDEAYGDENAYDGYDDYGAYGDDYDSYDDYDLLSYDDADPYGEDGF